MADNDRRQRVGASIDKDKTNEPSSMKLTKEEGTKTASSTHLQFELSFSYFRPSSYRPMLAISPS